MRILVSGGTGFVGRRLVARLVSDGHAVTIIHRSDHRHAGEEIPGLAGRIVLDLARWRDGVRLAGPFDAVAHLAGIAHVVDGRDDAALAERYRAVNTDATLALARAALDADARRFVFLSSVRVHGDPPRGVVLDEKAPLAPADPYARSKAAAEEGLARLQATVGLEPVVLRPPLVYGPEVRANFLRLLDWVDRGVWLPLGAIRNRRSLAYVDTLVAAIHASLVDPRAAGRTFMISDGEDVSTPELIRRIARALAKPARLLPVPVAMLRAGFFLLGRSADFQRLSGDVAVDASRIGTTLELPPRCSLDEGLAETARWYRDRARARRR